MDEKELIGVTLGTCTLERVIGRGGMGAVFLAQQSRPMRTVAVKVLLPPNYDPDQQRVFLARFRREADTVAKLEHKNILEIFEYDEAIIDGQQLAYLVMPFIRGGTLRQRIDEMRRSGRTFDFNEISSYLNQIADALSYAHSFGIVHRDIKPGNLLFHQDGRLLLSDFGIVRLQAMPALTSVGSFLGTAEYASPEQISTGDVDFHSDIYSLGCILYELLAGTVPFTGSNPFAVMTRKLNDPVPSIRNYRPDLSVGIDAVVMKALAKNPNDRYQSATMLASDFKTAIGGNSPSAMHLSGDGNHNDLTIPEKPWGMISTPEEITAPSIHDGIAAHPFQPASPAIPAPVGGVGASVPAPWQQGPRGWQWPSQMQSQAQVQDEEDRRAIPDTQFAGSPASALPSTSRTTPGTSAPAYREGRRVSYYSIALVAFLLQFLVFILLFGKSRVGGELTEMLGVLLGSSINFLALAAVGFTGVTRNRPVRRFLYEILGLSLLAPLMSGLFINFGNPQGGIHLPIVAYLILLASNIYAVRQLGRVDAAHEQIEVAPVEWRSAFIGAVTGLLPLTIILAFALATPFSQIHNAPPLLSLFVVLFIISIGTPTPGAVMTVILQKHSFPVLVRTSAIAGAMMFLGAIVLVILWGLVFSNHSQLLSNLSQTWVALLVLTFALTIIGLLRGMLDTWVYQRLKDRNT